MTIISKPWKLYNTVKTALTGGKQKTTGTEVIDKVKPNVPVTKGEKLKSQIKIATQKSKAAQAKLDNTIFRIEQQKKRLEEKKAKGGRVGLKFGSKKSNVQKIQETFGPKKKLSPKQMKIAKQAGDPNKIEGVDFKKLQQKRKV
jgi:hypothetical protein